MAGGRFGAQLTGTGVCFSVWAPAAERVDVVLDRVYPLSLREEHFFSAELSGVRAGTKYKFRINNEIDVPDPASSFQPDDVSGPSEVIDHASYSWRSTGWRGRPWHEAVILEAHIGAFTPEGTFRSAIRKLDHLAEAGITALELMPVADFPGARNWGYDGAFWSAPDSIYGRPDDLKALIDEAHLRGVMVFLDVVYNHFGPEGNYLGLYAPDFFTDAQTPWGSAIEYKLSQVQAFAVESALRWLRDYRFDGLRLDAVHAIIDPGKTEILRAISVAVGKLAEETGRHIHLVLENDDNAARLIDPGTPIPRGKYRAQWNDDYHHAWHVLLTGETDGYYGDYKGSPLQDIVRALGSGFVYQGETSAHRGGRSRGETSSGLAPIGFVNFLQNHDQIGNRALGDRLESHAKTKALKAALAVTLLAPTIPMLFMGEEWGSRQPFPFFCDFQGELAKAVRKGRRAEFADSYAKFGDEIPDPLNESTFRSAVLDWDACSKGSGKRRLTFVRQLLAIRRHYIIPRLPAASFGTAHAKRGLLSANWHMGENSVLSLLANLSNNDIARPHSGFEGTLIWGGELKGDIPPWTAFWWIGQENAAGNTDCDLPSATHL